VIGPWQSMGDRAIGRRLRWEPLRFGRARL